ncbi:MAG: alpha/beta hydrolase [Bacteroidetes bacterium]|nr:alpha/beta hydrolase [Bacteroidota bacterium]
MKIFFHYILLAGITAFLLFNLTACAFRSVSRTKHISYTAGEPTSPLPQQHLNVFAARNSAALSEVLIFIHGGNWNSGKKSLYSFLGNRMARKGVVTVIIDYPLSPQANYNDMAIAAAKSVKWVKENIQHYGGNPDKIFVSGHSAGGQLAALITLQHAYFDSLGMVNPIKGAILIDAAGLDMYGYLKERQYEKGHTYLQTFTTNPNNWKAATPLYHLHQQMPPLLIYRGGDTYPSIIRSNEKFVNALNKFTPKANYHVLKGKKHIPMITQFFWTWNPLYDQMIDFMQRNDQQAIMH